MRAALMVGSLGRLGYVSAEGGFGGGCGRQRGVCCANKDFLVREC